MIERPEFILAFTNSEVLDGHVFLNAVQRHWAVQEHGFRQTCN